ncbi:MAG: UDP-N-acetylmuramate dehydrogenase [Bacteroidota bacterium]
MAVSHNVSLQGYNTFGIDVKAESFCNITSLDQLSEVLQHNHKNPIFILGGGSNMLLTQDIKALVLHINMKGIDVISETSDKVIVKANAGENWHDFVLWCLDHGYGGIENLSLIPGNIGSAPIQNIGAYGVELKDVFVSCEAVSIKDQSVKVFSKEDCKFDYRESVFKQVLKGQYIVTSIVLELSKRNHKLHMDYGAIRNELESAGVTAPTIRDISNAVIAIRQSKLPDPKEIGNSGSFFKNPIISTDDFNILKAQFPKVPHYIVSPTEIKIPAGWLIETAGFKGKRFNNYGVHKKQALVLVNYGGANGRSIFDLAKLIQKTVKRLFKIDMEMEVNII